jgi:tetratricopeptide (TPR) repeat protein
MRDFSCDKTWRFFFFFSAESENGGEERQAPLGETVVRAVKDFQVDNDVKLETALEYAGKGELPATLQLFLLIANAHPSSANWNNVGVTQLRLEEWERARDSWEIALKDNPHDEIVLRNRALLEVKTGITLHGSSNPIYTYGAVLPKPKIDLLRSVKLARRISF